MFTREEESEKPIVFASLTEKSASLHAAEWIHSTGRNDWKGWYCSAGKQSLYIDFDGNVFVGTCSVGGWYGNIFREGLDSQKSLNQWIKCTAKSCPCGADMMAPKVKTKSLIPSDINDIYKNVEPGTNLKKSADVKNPEMVFSHTTKNVKLVIWDLSRRCNYACSYCFPGSHNNYEAHKSLGSLKHAVDGLHNWWLEDYPGKFVITGGEPTVNPQYLEFVTYIKQKRVGNIVHTTTNGSRDAKFFNELMVLSDITFSGHMESLSQPRVYERFVDNIRACVEKKNSNPEAALNFLQVRLMLKPGTLDLVKRLFVDIRQIPEFQKHGFVNCDLLHETGDKGQMIPYTANETNFVVANT